MKKLSEMIRLATRFHHAFTPDGSGSPYMCIALVHARNIGAITTKECRVAQNHCEYFMRHHLGYEAGTVRGYVWKTCGLDYLDSKGTNKKVREIWKIEIDRLEAQGN